jgi:hypothetical protein
MADYQRLACCLIKVSQRRSSSYFALISSKAHWHLGDQIHVASALINGQNASKGLQIEEQTWRNTLLCRRIAVTDVDLLEAECVREPPHLNEEVEFLLLTDDIR